MKSGTKISIFQRDNCIYPPNYNVPSQKTPTIKITAIKTSKSYKKYMLLSTQNRMHKLQHSTSQDTARYNLLQYAHSSRMHWFSLFCYTDFNNFHSSFTIVFLQVHINQDSHTSNGILLEQHVLSAPTD